MLPAFFSVILLIFIRSFESFEIPALVGVAGRRPCAHDVDLSRRAETAAAVWQRRRFFRAADARGRRHVISLFSRHARGRSVSDDYRQRIPAHLHPSRPLALRRRGRVAGLFLGPARAAVFDYSVGVVLPFYMQPSIEAFTKFTVKNYVTALHFPKITDSIKNSILLGLGSASVVMVLTLFASWVLVRTKMRGRWLLDILTTLPLLFPGIVMGLAILRFYLFVPIPVYGTLWILLIAFVTRYIPYGIRYTHSGLLQLHKELEEAAYISGASWCNSMRRIILPLITPSFLGGWVFIFLLSAKELSMSVLLVSPQTPVVSVAIFELVGKCSGR